MTTAPAIASTSSGKYGAAVVLVLLGATTWTASGFWSPAGAYSRFISPVIGLVWAAAVSGVVLTRPATREGW